MKGRLILFCSAVLLLAACAPKAAPVAPAPYIPEEALPDVVQCIPAPPAFNSPEFEYDSIRYEWGKAQRANPERLAEAVRDAIWSLDTTLAIMSVPFGKEVSPEKTP